MRQVGSYITYPLSHLCTHAHKCACVHTHTHTHAHIHIHIHITHTRQPLYSVRPLYLTVQILGVTWNSVPFGAPLLTRLQNVSHEVSKVHKRKTHFNSPSIVISDGRHYRCPSCKDHKVFSLNKLYFM